MLVSLVNYEMYGVSIGYILLDKIVGFWSIENEVYTQLCMFFSA